VNAFGVARPSRDIGAMLLLAAATVLRRCRITPNAPENSEAKILELLPVFWRRYLVGVEIHVPPAGHWGVVEMMPRIEICRSSL
jgi:hypothetical protein